jgi:hypothetical protein
MLPDIALITNNFGFSPGLSDFLDVPEILIIPVMVAYAYHESGSRGLRLRANTVFGAAEIDAQQRHHDQERQTVLNWWRHGRPPRVKVTTMQLMQIVASRGELNGVWQGV